VHLSAAMLTEKCRAQYRIRNGYMSRLHPVRATEPDD
jgi:hypothetical protein